MNIFGIFDNLEAIRTFFPGYSEQKYFLTPSSSKLVFSKRCKIFLVGVIYLEVSLKIFKIDKGFWRSLEILEIFKIFKNLQRKFNMGSNRHGVSESESVTSESKKTEWFTRVLQWVNT